MCIIYVKMLALFIVGSSVYIDLGGHNQIVNYCIQAEGIFRINAENSQEEYVRDQLNRGVVPEGIDVHCLAGLIKV